MAKPELLRWAREDAGYSIPEAAQKLQTSDERLLSFEEGENRPTINQLRRLANIYKRPLAVFFLPEPPKDFQAMRDFRRLPGEYAEHLSPELRREIRRARYRRDAALQIAADLGEETPELDGSATIDEDPEMVGRRMRDLLGVPLEAQLGWTGRYEAFNGWRGVFEANGVLVFQARRVDLDEMRAFSIDERPLPVIAVNASDAVYGRVFSLFHEFTHLLLNAGGLCDLHEDGETDPTKSRVEVFCNHAAGAALVPRQELLNRPIMDHGKDDWTDREIQGLAREFSVSREVVLRRLVILGMATSRFYQQKRELYQEEYRRRRREKSGFAPHHLSPIISGGPYFTRLVLDAYNAERISTADVSDLFDVRLKHLPDIEDALGRYPRSVAEVRG